MGCFKENSVSYLFATKSILAETKAEGNFQAHLMETNWHRSDVADSDHLTSKIRIPSGFHWSFSILHQFPFRILGLHCDNGSEYINHQVAELLEKMRIEFTKSRANRSQDNALVEGKNGAVIRKLIGYGHIAGEHAEALQKFYTASLNPYLNFHRPCGFATVSYDERGKRKRIYPAADYATPYEKLKALPEAAGYLKENVSFASLDPQANRMSDTECAKKMATAKATLLRRVKSESPIPPRFP